MEDYSRLLLDGVADLARCAHCTHCSTTSTCKLPTNDWDVHTARIAQQRLHANCPQMIEMCKLHALLNNVCMQTARIAQQRLHANCPQMIEKEQWPTSSPYLTPMDISCLTSDAWSFLKS